MPRTRRHFLDDQADDLFDWMQGEIDVLTEAMQEGGRSPFAAQVTEDQKLEFYRYAMFNKDGSPNAQGRQETLARVGVQGYAAIMAALNGSRGDGTMPDVRDAQITMPGEAA